MGGANQDERREHGLSRSFIVTTAAGRSNLIPRMAHATRAAALTVLLGRVVNLAPNAGKQSAFGSVDVGLLCRLCQRRCTQVHNSRERAMRGPILTTS